MSSTEKETKKALYDALFNQLQGTLSPSQDIEKLLNYLQCDDEKKEDISSSLDLMIYLRQTKALSPDNVDNCLEAFVQCSLFRAANLVKEYIESTSKSYLNMFLQVGNPRELLSQYIPLSFFFTC